MGAGRERHFSQVFAQDTTVNRCWECGTAQLVGTAGRPRWLAAPRSEDRTRGHAQRGGQGGVCVT